MNVDTCATLAQIFPLALITIVLESRSVHFNLRKRRFYREALIVSMSASLTGIVLSVIGVAIGGFGFEVALWLWVLFALAIVGLSFVTMGIMATDESAIDKRAKSKNKKKRRHPEGQYR